MKPATKNQLIVDSYIVDCSLPLTSKLSTNQPRLSFFCDLTFILTFVSELAFCKVRNLYSFVSASFSSALVGVNRGFKKYVFARIKRKSILFSIRSLILLTALAAILVLLTAITVSATVTRPWVQVAVDTSPSGTKECGKIGNANNAGGNEIVAGTTGYIYMYEWDGDTWSRTVIDGTLGSATVNDLVIANVDNTGGNKIAAALSTNTIYMYEWTGSGWDRTTVSTAVDDDESASVLDLSVGNADNLGGNKIVASTDSGEAVMFEWTGSSWSRTEICDYSNKKLPNAEVADCDNDGKIEVVVCKDNYAYEYYYSSGTWVDLSDFHQTENGLNVDVGNADNTGGNKILVSTDRNDIYMYKWTGSWTQTTVTSNGQTDIYDIKIGDVYNDGYNSIVAGDENAAVKIYTWNSGTSSWDSFTVDDAAGGAVLEVTSGDADNDGKNEIVVGVGSDIFLYEIITWESYRESGHSTVWGTVANPYSSTYPTVYMHGTGFKATHAFRVAYYDANAAKIETDDVYSDTYGDLSSDCVFSSYPASDPGTWHAIVCEGTETPPSTYDSGWAGIIADDSFTVEQSAIQPNVTVTYYFDDWSTTEEWKGDPEYMVDGDTGTYGYCKFLGGVDWLTSNTCPGTELGTISKVEIRAYGYVQKAEEQLRLRPVFTAGDGSDHNAAVPLTTGGWGSYIDITTDTNAPSPWTWSNVSNLDCDVVCYHPAPPNLYIYGAKAEIRVTYTPTWVSYSDSGHTTECNDFASYESEHTVYMHGSGFTPDTGYRIIFWDGTGANRKTDDKNSDANGNLDSSHTFVAGTDQAGTWYATVYYPQSYSPGSHDPHDAELVVDDTFTVQQSAIPEFPAVISAIAVCMLCAVAYMVMRRKVGKR